MAEITTIPCNFDPEERIVLLWIRTYAERDEINFRGLVDWNKLKIDTSPVSVGVKTFQIDNENGNTTVKIFITRVSPSANMNLPISENTLIKHWTEVTHESLASLAERAVEMIDTN
ncbi:MAG: hypothetical protein ACFFCQ_10085 [Promethearchaeota archaeon]